MHLTRTRVTLASLATTVVLSSCLVIPALAVEVSTPAPEALADGPVTASVSLTTPPSR